MNYKKWGFCLLLANLANLFVTSIASASVSSLNLTPYGGVDLGIQNIKFKSGYGDNLFKSTLPKGNFYLGLKFNECFGVEAGYETTLRSSKKNVFIYTPGKYLGVPLTSNDIVGIPLDHVYTPKNTIKNSGWHIGISGNYPIRFKTLKNPIYLLGYIGIKHNKIQLYSNLEQAQAPGLPIIPVNEINKFRSVKNILRLSAGLQYFFHENFGIKILGTYEQLSKINPSVKSNQGGIALYQAKLKNSLGYSIGIVVKK